MKFYSLYRAGRDKIVRLAKRRTAERLGPAGPHSHLVGYPHDPSTT